MADYLYDNEFTASSLHIPPSAAMISKALTAMLLSNPQLSFLTFLCILLFVNDRDGTALWTQSKIHLFHLPSEVILHCYEKAC